MKKIVITGAPCSGKSSLIEELRKRGKLVVSETAREVLSEGKPVGMSDLELKILRRQLEKERALANGENMFLDRGVVDIVAYSNIHLGGLPEELKDFNFKNLYDLVFLLDRLPLIKDDVRIEDDALAELIHEELRGVYIGMGYRLIEVPDLGIKGRADFVLSYVEKMREGSNMEVRRLDRRLHLLRPYARIETNIP